MRAGRLVGLGVVVLAAAAGCGVVIGATDDKVLRVDDGGAGTTELADGGEGDGAACKPGEKLCSGACVSMSSPEFGCGAADCTPCSLPNTAALMCTADGLCAAGKCRAGFGACGPATNGCPDDLTKPATCQSCTIACAPSQVCAPSGCAGDCGSLENCTGSCVDTKTSPTNCGTCGHACTASANGDPSCVNGGCATDCREGYFHCDGNPNGACVALTVFYLDTDGDGYGDSAQSKQACDAAAAGPGYVAQGGDCNDANPDVHPGQTQYFTVGYTAAGGATSFDYNCDGVEGEQAGFVHFSACGSAPGCSTPANSYRTAYPSRSGTNIDAYCGSTRYASCKPDGAQCEVNSTTAPVAIGCR